MQCEAGGFPGEVRRLEASLLVPPYCGTNVSACLRGDRSDLHTFVQVFNPSLVEKNPKLLTTYVSQPSVQLHVRL